MIGFGEALAIIVTVPTVMVGSIVHAIIWTRHRYKIEEIKSKTVSGLPQEIKSEFASLRADMHNLRDTTMQYDLSFDTALQQMDRRLGNIEASKHYSENETTKEKVSSRY